MKPCILTRSDLPHSGDCWILAEPAKTCSRIQLSPPNWNKVCTFAALRWFLLSLYRVGCICRAENRRACLCDKDRLTLDSRIWLDLAEHHAALLVPAYLEEGVHIRRMEFASILRLSESACSAGGVLFSSNVAVMRQTAHIFVVAHAFRLGCRPRFTAPNAQVSLWNLLEHSYFPYDK